MKQDESRDLLLSVFGVVMLIIVITGVTYAIFRYTASGKKTNIITTSAIDMSYVESDTNVISINDAIPISDFVGKRQEEYFDFTLSSSITGLLTINYDIVASRVVVSNEIDPNKIKVYLEKYIGGEYKEVLPPTRFNQNSERGMTLYSDSFSNIENKRNDFVSNYRFRMWLDENEQLEDISKSFKLKINVYAEA